MKSPEQELYDTIFSKIMDMGYTVYDYLPPANENVEYPFVVVGNVESVGQANKGALFATISIHIDVWGSRTDRMSVTTITDALYKSLVNGIQGEDYEYKPRFNQNTKQFIQDTSIPDQIFNRGMLDLNYFY